MIRFGREEDIEALRLIYNDEVEHSVATFDLDPRTPEEMEAWFRAHHGIHRLLVWEEAGEAVAYATLSPYRQRKAFDATVELSVYVRQDQRGRNRPGADGETVGRSAPGPWYSYSDIGNYLGEYRQYPPSSAAGLYLLRQDPAGGIQIRALAGHRPLSDHGG